MSYNTHGFVGHGGHHDLDAVLKVIAAADADAVGLQEVTDDDRESRRFIRELEHLPFQHVLYGPTLRNERGDFGNVLLSKWPVDHVEHLDLSVGRHEPRGAIRAIIRHPEAPADVTVTHLGLWPGERREQVRRLLDHWETHPPGADIPVRALLGDLNEWWIGARLLRRLHRDFGRSAHLRTFPARLPCLALDRIFVDAPGRSVRSTTLRDGPAATASDHLPVIAEIRREP